MPFFSTTKWGRFGKKNGGDLVKGGDVLVKSGGVFTCYHLMH